MRQTANVLAAYGRLLIAEGELGAAEPMLAESLTLRQAQFGKSHPVIADSLLSLATLRIAQKRSKRPYPCRARLLRLPASFSPNATRSQRGPRSAWQQALQSFR